MILFFVAGTLLLFIGIFRFGFLIPDKSGIPILMYHNIAHGKQDALTVSPTTFSQQMDWLQKNGYCSLSFLLSPIY